MIRFFLFFTIIVWVIRAVVSFLQEADPPFSNAYGKTFRFRGKLLKFEPAAREIYLSCGMTCGVES
ncbi:MAG: hypothetical protein J5858_03040 [Lentisphaeria bacterium]|nr:hypothetical protein [Lentisphaeria bacterium]